MTKVTESARFVRVAAGITVGLLMTASGYSAAMAGEVTPANTNGFQHFFDCFGAMIHDGQAHQQYCSPGNAAGPGNNSLGSFSGGAGPACVTESVMLERSFDPVKVASLTPDFYVDAPVLNAPAFRQAGVPRCCSSASLSVPVDVNVASLMPDFFTGPSMPRTTTTQVAISCCLSSLDAPAFQTYQTASLDDSIGSELQTQGRHNLLLAICVD